MSDQRFHEALRSELLEAADEQYKPPPRRSSGRWWLLGATALLILAFVFAAFVFRSEDDLSADVQVVVDGDDLIVRLSGIESSREEIEAAAEEFGLDLMIEEVPVGPSNVGAFAGSLASELPPQLSPLDGQHHRFRGFRIPADWDGELVLSLGREAAPGEDWVVPSDAQAEGEPAECMQLIGDTVADASRSLSERDLSLRWFAMGLTTTEYPHDDIDAIANWKVVSVEATSPTDVQIQATPDGSWPGPSVAKGGIPPSTNPAC